MENYSTLSRDKTFRKKSYRLILYIVILIAILYGVLFSVENYFGGGGVDYDMPKASSYSTQETGTNAWFDLLRLNSYKVTRDRGTIDVPKLPSNLDLSDNNHDLLRNTSVLIVLGGAVPEDEIPSIKNFVKQGGRLITDNPYTLTALFGNKVKIQDAGTKYMTPNREDVKGLQSIETLTGTKHGSITYDYSDSSVPLLLDRSDPKTLHMSEKTTSPAAIFTFGDGDVIALMDIGPVTNSLIGQKDTDNALFSLRIVGTPTNKVTFAEGVVGFDDSNGFAGIPLPSRIAIIGLLIGLVIFGSTQSRRFGVSEEKNRPLGPRRIYFAYAIAQAINKSKKKN